MPEGDKRSYEADALRILVMRGLRSLAYGLLSVLLGVFLAMLPGMLGTTVIGHQLMASLRDGQGMNKGVVAATLMALAALVFFTQRWWKRVQAQL